MTMNKLERKTWAGHLACSEERECAENFGRENQVQYHLEDTTTTTTIKETVKKMRRGIKNGMPLAENRGRGCSRVKRVIRTQVTQNAGELFG